MTVRRQAVALAGLAVTLLLAATACSDPEPTSEAFCEKLAFVTGPEGVEAAIAPGTSTRIDGLVSELRLLEANAPDDILSTVRSLVRFFEQYQEAPRDGRRDLLVDAEGTLRDASKDLNSYALSECGLFLQRAVPTPIPTVNPSIEAPVE